ncbi:MAG: hypothetical protein SGARI_007054, partial [Bacillariaceae sp.]
MSNSDDDKYKAMFSTDTAPVDGPPGNPAVFPCIMVGTAMVLGSALYAGGVEQRLTMLFDTPQAAVSFYKTTGALAITAAHGFCIILNANGRRVFGIPHPKSSTTEVGYLNATRGYYNMVEHLPFFLFNYFMAYENTPCIAGVASIVFGIGRIVYAKGYAYKGPEARSTGFMMATMSSMACLGIALCNSVL